MAFSNKILFKNWRLGYHLVFNTKKIGVNNLWISSGNSLWGSSILKIILNIILIYPIWYNFKVIRWRMGKTVGFVPEGENYK